MTYHVRDPQAERWMREAALSLKKTLPEGYGFTLMVFTYGEGGHTVYASTATRNTAIAALEELLGLLKSEGKPAN